MDPVVYQVFNTWELVNQIFSRLPWHKAYHMRNISEETLNYCQRYITEIDYDNSYELLDEDYFDLFKLMGASGCEKLVKLDLRKSSTISQKIGPILKYCERLKKFAFTKTKKGSKFYFNMLYCSEIEEFAVNSSIPKFFSDSDVIELHLILPKLQHLEIPSTGITNASMLEIAEEQVHLKYLDISNCQGISDYGLTHIFEKCTNLIGLNVTDTPTMHHCIEDLTIYSDNLTHLKANRTFLSFESSLLIKEWFDEKRVTYEFLHDDDLLLHDEMVTLLEDRPDEQLNDGVTTTSSTSSEESNMDLLFEDVDSNELRRQIEVNSNYLRAHADDEDFLDADGFHLDDLDLSGLSSVSSDDDDASDGNDEEFSFDNSDLDIDNESDLDNNEPELENVETNIGNINESNIIENNSQINIEMNIESDSDEIDRHEIFEPYVRFTTELYELERTLRTRRRQAISSNITNQIIPNSIQNDDEIYARTSEDISDIDIDEIEMMEPFVPFVRRYPERTQSSITLALQDLTERRDMITWNTINTVNENLRIMEKRFNELVDMMRQ